MRLEERTPPDVTRDEEIAEEVRLYELWQQEQDRRRWRANYRRYLSTSDEPRTAA